jgi:hypothetical protein
VNILKHIYLTIIERGKRAWFYPQTVATDRERRRQLKVVRSEYESDRLDRLRNPSRYQGR